MATMLTECTDGMIDHAALDRLVRFGGNKLLKDMIVLFLADAPPRLVKAREGASARDRTAVSRALHALKSSSGQLGAFVMMDRCGEGEALAIGGDSSELEAAVARVEQAFASARVELERRLL